MKQLLLILFFSISLQSLWAQDAVYVNTNPKNDWESYMIPGIGYTTYMPGDWRDIGIFHGISTEFTFYNATRPAFKGPAFFRIYGRFSLLRGLEDRNLAQFSYGIGSNMSFEKTFNRKVFIPYFGIELGSINRNDLNASFQISPLLGINLVSTKHFAWFVQGGYGYATSRNFDKLSGVFAQSGFCVMFW